MIEGHSFPVALSRLCKVETARRVLDFYHTRLKRGASKTPAAASA